MHAAPTTVAMPAVTHDDLSIRKAQERRMARSSSQVAVALVALSVICGLVAFILCLAAEGSRSEARCHRSPAQRACYICLCSHSALPSLTMRP